ncbi:hypothetical protein [Acinetobacter pittii]|uniref:hypothetical protein n=1 Tax=Acinetobacter pittii TaxID=48296 RepID=UPI00037C5953|nr:hypothetical protein [Acinetobacter pittii]CDH42278.1 hypothetical protein APICBIBUN_20130 [Acinetobacter pittii 42F]
MKGRKFELKKQTQLKKIRNKTHKLPHLKGYSSLVFHLERDQILQTGMSNETKQQSVQELRKKYFGTNEEQLRAQAYETMHDQKNN